jgi:O-antigen/teichoic acid export membrane protein
MHRSTVAASAAWMLAGTAAVALSQYLIVVVLARAADAAAVGQYALGLAVATPVCLIAGLGLRTVLVTDPYGVADFARYRRLRLVSAGIAMAVTAVIALAIGGSTGVVVGLVGVAKAIDAVLDIHIGLFQRVERIRQAGGCLIANAAATVAATLALLTVTPDAMAAALGSALGSLAAWAFYCVPSARSLLRALPVGEGRSARGPAGAPSSAPHRSLAGLVWIALPLGLATFIAALGVSVPRYVVAYHLELAALGVFTAIGYIMVTANLIASATSQSLLPRMSRLFATGQHARLLRLTGSLAAGAMALGGVAVAACTVRGGDLLRLLYGPGYEPYAPALMIVVAAAGVSGAVFCVGTALNATRRFRSQLVASCVTLAVTTGLAVILVPHGVVPAAWTLLLPLVVDGGLKAVLLWRILRTAARGSARPGDPRPVEVIATRVTSGWVGGSPA